MNAIILVIVVLCSPLVCTAPSSTTPTSSELTSSSTLLIPQESPEYSQLVLQQRNWTSVEYPCSSVNVSICLQYPNRDKQMRLQSIRDYVLSTLGHGKVPSSPGPSSTPQTTPFSGEIKKFFGSCDIPHRVNLEDWRDASNFHIFFNLTQHTNQDVNTSSKLRTVSAKLKLFKKPLPPVELVYIILNDTTTTTLSVPSVQEKLRVSLFWYKTPFAGNHYKKKLLDTKMVGLRESGWLEFDILNAVQMWQNNKNFGLVVELENEDNLLLDTEQYFDNSFCPGNNSNFTLPAVVHIPQLEICLLNTPQPQREMSEGPLPFSEGLGQLSRIAQSHYQQQRHEWQNDPTTTAPRRHRLRHRKAKRVHTTATPDFQLADDHPLRRILATAATNVRGHEEEELSTERDIIIQKFYIGSGGGSGGEEES